MYIFYIVLYSSLYGDLQQSKVVYIITQHYNMR